MRAILVTLDTIDMILIAMLPIMVVISGQKAFISPFHLEDEPSMPNWIVTAGTFVLFNWLEKGPKKTAA